ncbi:hypothetical protein Neosp_012163 [[Neocosmospora] mangrovei]
MTSSESSSEILTLASECSELFQDCAHSGPEDDQASVASLFKVYGAWCFNLGVFAPPTAPLDQTLRYSDEIRGFVTQLLLMLRRNLEFIKIQSQPKDSLRSTKPRPNENEGVPMEELEGTVEEALRAIVAVLQRLDRLGATIQKYSASSLSSRLKSFAEQKNDEKYRLLATKIVAFKYPMATPSLRTQLVEAMTDRRQRLRYIRQHQQKTVPKDRQGLKTRKHHNTNTSNHKPSDFESDQPTSKNRAATLRDQGVSRSSGSTLSQDTETTSSTDSWTFLPTSSAMERTRCDKTKSVISSSEANTTRMVGDMNNYPEPPTHEQWNQDPKCPTCWNQLKESELEDKKWRRHVDTDLEPYVCISEDCRKPLQFFADLSLWENHMRNQHSTKWTQLVHKPTVWRCDFEHDEEEFCNEEAFQEHIRKRHSDSDESERRMIATLGTGVEARAKHICPLCGYNPTLGQENPSDSTSSTPQKSEMDQLSELAKHIAGHLRCLAFHTLDHLDSDQESVSDQDSNATSVKARSRSRSPNGLKDFEDVSSGFGTNGDPTSVSKFDETRSSREEDRPVDEASPQIVPIPPKSEEPWEVIKETNPTEEDTVVHHMMLYTLWDRAYDTLKKMSPLLVERYEMLLSLELSVDPEGESKQIFNVFRGADIHKRRTLLNNINNNLLEQMCHTFESNQVTESVMQAVEWLSTSAMGFPMALLPRVGFFLVLRFLANVETRGGGDWRGFIILMSRLPWHSILEYHLRSVTWTSSDARMKELIQLEQSSLQLCQKMLELQIRSVVPDDQLDDLEELLSEAKSLDREVMDQASAAGIPIDLAPIQPGHQWTAATMLELVTALGPVQENIRLLDDLFEIDPRNVKHTIEKLSGWLLSDRLSRVLEHPSFLQFQNDPHTRLFWIQGRLATGKTTLLCSMIDHLSANLTVVPYFFCQIPNPNLNNGTAVLRGLLYLLARDGTGC